ncbi:sulfotransferase family 2 domain-containing protein [Rhizobium sp. SL86]|uniref:sulfotransferase family 2 domain-containing protein n=1 Tax=Rhizobium sp. SL86 TaxID=2995148 RepID=UPI0022732B2D|nr:sulfotransferase family 2 domain-containing protein [Rhizobium sp. SL86]MCY1669396.1 sulfotransferase family 2 domain-containing protein [Rhizobium sp. SL86]
MQQAHFEYTQNVRMIFRHCIGRWPSSSELRCLIGMDPDKAPHLDFVIKSIVSSRDYLKANSHSLAFKKLFFFEIPKAAGTSIINAIRISCNPWVIAPVPAKTVSGYETGDAPDEFRGYDVYLGRFSRTFYQMICPGFPYIINFRNPIDRVLSLYNHFRDEASTGHSCAPLMDAADVCIQAARTLSFSDFVASEHPDIRAWISDFQFRQLSFQPLSAGIGDAALNSVLAFVDKALVSYIYEYPDISERAFRQTLGVASIPHVNPRAGYDGTIGRSEIALETQSLINALNQRDLRIYQHAVDRIFS